jgi:hypothetical protein
MPRDIRQLMQEAENSLSELQQGIKEVAGNDHNVNRDFFKIADEFIEFKQKIERMFDRHEGRSGGQRSQGLEVSRQESNSPDTQAFLNHYYDTSNQGRGRGSEDENENRSTGQGRGGGQTGVPKPGAGWSGDQEGHREAALKGAETRRQNSQLQGSRS